MDNNSERKEGIKMRAAVVVFYDVETDELLFSKNVDNQINFPELQVPYNSTPKKAIQTLSRGNFGMEPKTIKHLKPFDWSTLNNNTAEFTPYIVTKFDNKVDTKKAKIGVWVKREFARDYLYQNRNNTNILTKRVLNMVLPELEKIHTRDVGELDV